jgi:ATP-dependent DNA helicase RecQ
MRADLGRLVRFNQQRAGDPELAIAHERGWRDYKTIKSFIYSDRCRRRSVLDHFSDRVAGRPLHRCCDVCDVESWLPDPETIAVRPVRRSRNAAAAPAPELAPADITLFEELKAWRLRAAEGKPAYTVAHNSTLEAVAAARPTDAEQLAEIRGIGPSFVAKYAGEVLTIVSSRSALPNR